MFTRPITQVPFGQVLLGTQARCHIKEVALLALKELVFCLPFAYAASLFAVTPIVASMFLQCTVTIVALAALLRMSSFWLKALKPHLQPFYQSWAMRIAQGCDYWAFTSVILNDLSTRKLVIHEGGHYLAASLLFRGSRPRITLNHPFLGGSTAFSTYRLTPLGSLFGNHSSRLIIAAAGVAAELAVSIVEMGIDHFQSGKRPQLCKYLYASAIATITNAALYALSALLNPDPSSGHDFAQLAAGGIHPLLATAVILAVPYAAKRAMEYYKRGGSPSANYLEEIFNNLFYSAPLSLLRGYH